MVFGKKKTSKKTSEQKLIPNLVTSAGESDECPESGSRIMRNLRKKFTKSVPKKAQVLTSKKERETQINAERMKRENPGLEQEPNRLQRRAMTRTNSNAINEAVKSALEDQDRPIELPMLLIPEYDSTGKVITRYHTPVSDCTMSLAQKLKKITSIRDVHALSKLIQRPALATNATSRVHYWMNATEVKIPELRRYLLEIAVAHFDFSVKHQKIIDKLPEEAIFDADAFKSYSIVTRKGNTAIRKLDNHEREDVLDTISELVYLFNQISEITKTIKPDNQEIMSYEEAHCLLNYITSNRYLDLWPTHICNGHPAFSSLAYTTLASHSKDVLEDAYRYSSEQQETRWMKMADRPIGYYQCYIELMQNAPNATLPLDSYALRDEVNIPSRKKMYEYHIMNCYPRLPREDNAYSRANTDEATDSDEETRNLQVQLRNAARYDNNKGCVARTDQGATKYSDDMATIEKRLQEAKELGQARNASASVLSHEDRVNQATNLLMSIEEIIDRNKGKPGNWSVQDLENIMQLDRRYKELVGISNQDELKILRSNFDKGTEELEKISSEDEDMIAKRRKDETPIPASRLRPPNTPYETADEHSMDFSGRAFAGNILHASPSTFGPPQSSYQPFKRAEDPITRPHTGRAEDNYNNGESQESPNPLRAPFTQVSQQRQPPGMQGGGNTSTPQQSDRRNELTGMLSHDLRWSAADISQCTDQQLEDMYSQSIKLRFSETPTRTYNMVMRSTSDGSKALKIAEKGERPDCTLTQSQMDRLMKSPEVTEEMIMEIPSLKALIDESREMKRKYSPETSTDSMRTHVNESGQAIDSSNNGSTNLSSQGSSSGSVIPPSNNSVGLELNEMERRLHLNVTKQIRDQINQSKLENKAARGDTNNNNQSPSTPPMPEVDLELDGITTNENTPERDSERDGVSPPSPSVPVPLRRQNQMNQEDIDRRRRQLDSSENMRLPTSSDDEEEKTSEKRHVEEAEAKRKDRLNKANASLSQRILASRRVREAAEARQEEERAEIERKKKDRAERRKSKITSSNAKRISSNFSDDDDDVMYMKMALPTHSSSKIDMKRFNDYKVFEKYENFPDWYEGLDSCVYRLHNKQHPSDTEMAQYVLDKLSPEIMNAIRRNTRIDVNDLAEIQHFVGETYGRKESPSRDLEDLRQVKLRKGDLTVALTKIEELVGKLVKPKKIDPNDTQKQIDAKRQIAKDNSNTMCSSTVMHALKRDLPDLYNHLCSKRIIDARSYEQDYEAIRDELYLWDYICTEEDEDTTVKFQHVGRKADKQENVKTMDREMKDPDLKITGQPSGDTKNSGNHSIDLMANNGTGQIAHIASNPGFQQGIVQPSMMSQYPLLQQAYNPHMMYPQHTQMIPQVPASNIIPNAPTPELVKKMNDLWKILEDNKTKDITDEITKEVQRKPKKNNPNEAKKAHNITNQSDGANDYPRKPKRKYCRLCNEAGHQLHFCEKFQPELRETLWEDYERYPWGFCTSCKVKGHYATSCPKYKWITKILPKGVYAETDPRPQPRESQ